MTDTSITESRPVRNASAVAVFMCLAYVALMTVNTHGTYPLPPDSAQNADLARNLARGDGYVIQIIQYHAGSFDSVVHIPEMHGILQPLLQAGLFAVFGPHESWVRIPGFLFMATAGMLGFLYARRLFGPAAGLIACAIILTQPRLNNWAWRGTDDAGFACLFLAAVMTADWALANGRARSLALAGTIGGFAILQKTTGIILPMVYLAAAVVPGPSWRGALRRWAILCAPLLPFVVLYVVRNFLGHGSPGFRWGAIDWIFKDGGIAAWARVYDATPQLLPTLEAIGWPNVFGIIGDQLSWFARALFSLDPLWTVKHPTLTRPGLIAPLALIALFWHWRRQPRFVALFSLTLLAIVVLVCCVWHVEWRFFSLLVPLFAISFAGLVVRFSASVKVDRWLAPAVVAAAITVVAVLGFRAASRPVKESAQTHRTTRCVSWIAENTPPGSRVLTIDPWNLAWHADRPSILIPFGGPDAIVRIAERYRARWLILDPTLYRPEVLRDVEALRSGSADRMSLDLAFEEKPCSIYRINLPQSSSVNVTPALLANRASSAPPIAEAGVTQQPPDVGSSSARHAALSPSISDVER